ncbi:hypothetical protein [Altererythrobacter sp. BO-6]|uniref:hypothetical protein n=1 Tax=Altererythrobacter sp. BO-6 TaxID=2604537 RepID=UPI001F4A0443|nr:hypothetical protein [Altererythrobacter sp. BO-6]
MASETNARPAFVIRAGDLLAVNYLSEGHPRPLAVEWINRGTDQVLRQTTRDMLLRTLFQPVDTPSVQKLHDSAGLRVVFRSESERARFAAEFEAAREREQNAKAHLITAIFDAREPAEAAIAALKRAGFPERSLSLLCRASHFSDPDAKWPEGHGPLGIAGAVAGSGVAGALLGLAFLLVPGVGPVAAAGALASSAIASVASVSGIIGATGGAIAKMLTDHDVDGVSAAFYDRQIQRGKVFVAVDDRLTSIDGSIAREILDSHGGRTPEVTQG